MNHLCSEVRSIWLLLALVGSVCLTGCDRDSATTPSERPASSAYSPDVAVPIIPLDDVRIGMRGYGLSVFHGTRIEPFAVEVTSVMGDFGPGKAIIWIRCTDPRMQKSGAVSGMSGSPIYLWGPGESHRVGKGGRLAGAFAFGFSLTKDCYVGVQPIEYMRQVADRSLDNSATDAESARTGLSPGRQLRRLLHLAQRYETGEDRTWRLRAILDLLAPTDNDRSEADATAMVQAPKGVPGRVERMMLPVNVGSAELAEATAALFAPVGLAPMAAGGIQAGKPPRGVDIGKAQLRPGSVLAIPLLWGDLDLSASGTVTDVLPDGRVLALGHGMDSIGPIELPMATGFVHMVVPSIQSSFKLGGSGVIRGGLVRDENVGVIGTPTGTFSSAPLRVSVSMPGQVKQDYNYVVAHERSLTAILAAIGALESLAASQALPPDNTLRIRSTMKFAGGHELSVDSVVPRARLVDVLLALMPPVDTMINNGFESRKLEAMDVTMEVEPQNRLAALIEARLDHALLAPGDTVGITMKLQVYRKDQIEHRVKLQLPDDLEDGQYQLFLSDARTYLQMLVANQPHLMKSYNIDQLRQAIQRILSVREDTFYVTLLLPQPELAVGRNEMPKLPSSRLAMIADPSHTKATAYREMVHKTVPLDLVATGSHRFVITVDHTLKDQ